MAMDSVRNGAIERGKSFGRVSELDVQELKHIRKTLLIGKQSFENALHIISQYTK
jgi:hypothetical protein